MPNYQNDVRIIVEKEQPHVELERLQNRIRKYIGKDTIETDREFVDLILLIGAMVDLPMDEWAKAVNRINQITMQVEFGISPDEFEEIIRMASDDSEGPIN